MRVIVAIGVIAIAIALGVIVALDSMGPQSVGQRAEGTVPGSGSRSDSAQTAQMKQVEHASTKAPAAKGAIYPSVPIVSHPPEGTPVQMVLEQLETAAASGDARAACRVGMEKVRCTRANVRTGTSDAKSSADQTLCRGISAAQTRDGWKYLFQAAAAGNVAAMSLFVRDPGLSFSQPAESAEGWLLYRDNAPTFLTRAVEAGDVMALYFAWWNSATGFSTGGDRVFERDPYNALIYGTAALPLLDARRRATVQQLNSRIQTEVAPELVSRAAREGEALRRRHFQGAAPPRDTPDDAYLAPMECLR